MAETNAEAVFHTLNTQASVARGEDLASSPEPLCTVNAHLQGIRSIKKLIHEKAKAVYHALRKTYVIRSAMSSLQHDGQDV